MHHYFNGIEVARGCQTLRSLDELDGLATFGFRGQTLHALAVTSLVEIVSRPAGARVASTTVLHLGQRIYVGPAHDARATGTSVTVRSGGFRM